MVLSFKGRYHTIYVIIHNNHFQIAINKLFMKNNYVTTKPPLKTYWRLTNRHPHFRGFLAWIMRTTIQSSISLVSIHSDHIAAANTVKQKCLKVYVRICMYAICLQIANDVCKRRCKWSRQRVVRLPETLMDSE